MQKYIKGKNPIKKKKKDNNNCWNTNFTNEVRAFQCMTKMRNELALLKKRERERKKESLWKIEGERLKWHLGSESTIENNKTYCIHVYIKKQANCMVAVFSNNYINYIFIYLWKIFFSGPLENSNSLNLHGKITGPQHTYTTTTKSGSAFANKQWLFTHGLIDN